MGTAAATDDVQGPGERGPLSPASPLHATSLLAADIQALRDGSPRAFAAFHRAHSPRLYGYLVRLTRDRALADDLFQESWLRLARALPGLLADDGPRGNTPDLRAFVFALARNAFLDARRADRRRPTLPLDDDTTDSGPRDDAPSLEAVLADRQTLGYLEEVLGTLPDAAREILHLVAFEGMTRPGGGAGARPHPRSDPQAPRTGPRGARRSADRSAPDPPSGILMSDPLFEALRATTEAPDVRLAARSETEATAAFLAAHRRVELTASGRTERRTELTASANAPISRIFGALAVAAVVVLYGGWALVAAGGIYR